MMSPSWWRGSISLPTGSSWHLAASTSGSHSFPSAHKPGHAPLSLLLYRRDLMLPCSHASIHMRIYMYVGGGEDKIMLGFLSVAPGHFSSVCIFDPLLSTSSNKIL